MKNYRLLLLPLMISAAFEANSLELSNVIVKSDVSINRQSLNDRLEPLLGSQIDVSLLNRLLNEISAFYKNQGYLGAQAYFPEQESSDGILEVCVETAKLKEIVINDQSQSSKESLFRLLAKARSLQGRDINSKELNNALLRVRDLNVYDISGYFSKPDDSNNEDDDLVNLNLDIRAKKRFGFEAMYDNYGNSNTGKNRFSAVIKSHNTTRHADNLAFLASVSDKGQSSFLLNYEIPVSTHPTVFGTRVSYGFYDLKDEYASLGAKGTAFTLNGYVKEPLVRDSETKLSMTTGTYFKYLEDKLKSYSLNFKKLDYGVSEEFNLENQLGSFKLEHSFGVNLGHIKNQDKYALQKDRTFMIGTFASTIEYRFLDNLYVKNALSSQFANQNLDSSDKFIPGGAYGVAAFENNTASSDSGIFDDLRVGALFTHKSALFNVYGAFEQAYARNRNHDSESFYGLSLGAEANCQGFFVNTSLNKAIGHNSDYAKHSVKLLVKFGYNLI